jgi:hypothetical protein
VPATVFVFLPPNIAAILSFIRKPPTDEERDEQQAMSSGIIIPDPSFPNGTGPFILYLITIN